jgi:hypothetical protein
MPEENINKYSTAEIVIGTLFLLGVDFFTALLDLTGFGALISRIIKWLAQIVLLWWAIFKGDKNALKAGRVVAKFLINAVPILPTLTTIFVVETALHNNPKIIERFPQAKNLAHL